MSERDNKLEFIVENMYGEQQPNPNFGKDQDDNWNDDDEKQYNAPTISEPELVSGGDELVANLNMGDAMEEINILLLDPVNVDLKKGLITFEFDTGRGESFEATEEGAGGKTPCDHCNGTGKHDDEDCEKCNGTGMILNASCGSKH